jgi:uncharacterized protein YjaZ
MKIGFRFVRRFLNNQRHVDISDVLNMALQLLKFFEDVLA